MPQLQYVRKFSSQRNVWGHQGPTDIIPDPQRSDLWQVDFRNTINQIVTVLNQGRLLPIQPFEAQSVVLPDLRTRSESVPRDSRPFQMPSMDEPLEAIRMTFVMNSDQQNSSNLLRVLSGWRTLVRAGRGGMSAETSYALNDNFTVDFAFDVTLTLMRPGLIQNTGGQTATVPQTLPTNQNAGAPGLSLPTTPLANSAASQFAISSPSNTSANGVTKNDFDKNFAYTLKKCWLASHRVSDLSYADARILTVDATFFAEDIFSSDFQASTSGVNYATLNALPTPTT